MDKENKSMYPKVTTWDVFSVYWVHARKYIIYIIVIFVGVVVGVMLQNIITPIFYKRFFDTIQASTNPIITGQELISIILAIATLNVVSWVFYRSAWYFLAKFEVLVMRNYRQACFDYIIKHSHSFFSNTFTGSVVQKINRSTRAFERLTDRILVDIVPLILKVGGTIFVLSFIDKRIALGISIWVVVFLTISFVFNRFKLKYDIEGAKIDSRVSAVMSDTLSNHGAVQLFTGSNNESKNFGTVNNDFARIYIKKWSIGWSIDSVQSLLVYAIEFFIFYYAIKYWQVGLITIGTFVLAQAYILTINGSLWGFGRIVRDLYEATADAREMVEILKLPHEIKDIPYARPLVVSNGAIEFKNVDFTFGQNKPVFSNLSLFIKPGEKVAFIGSSGAGKSTLVKLLLRLHDIQSGEILIDNQNIKNVTVDSLRENISLVPQDTALFHRSLLENIRYGKRDTNDEAVLRASKLAHCDIFINEFSQKYETLVGERGVKLSGGERQRVAIARAILKNAPILILDEATSSLDSHSEALIQDALHTLMENKTTIIIAHRLSTIKKMDRIIVLGKDGIVEEGSHSDLIAKNGKYAKLWNLQIGGFGEKSIEELLES
jgi:ATP-binding cassette subfamily B protein